MPEGEATRREPGQEEGASPISPMRSQSQEEGARRTDELKLCEIITGGYDDLREFACVYSRHPGSSAWFLASVLRSVTPFPRDPLDPLDPGMSSQIAHP